MQRLARSHLRAASLLSLVSLVSLVSLSGCDKPKDGKADAKAGDAKAGDAKAADAKADAKPEAEPAPAVDPDYVDDTKGLGVIVREVAVDTGKPEVDASKAPKYDLANDAGGLIGHIATALAHDDELADAATTKELLKLSGEDEPGPSDGLICNHVWTDIFSTAYPTKTDADDTFIDACSVEVERARLKLGSEIFAQHAACVIAAKDLAALDLCDSAEQTAELWLHANPHGDKPDATLCNSGVEQMFILVSRDIGDDADLLEELEQDIYGIKDDAKIVCADEGSKAEIACIMKATKLVDLEGCRAPAEGVG